MSIPLAAIERISKKAGVRRISGGAIRELQDILDDLGFEIARDAASLARHAKRRTLTADDIRIASGKG